MTMTGPRSFKATIVPRRCTTKPHVTKQGVPLPNLRSETVSAVLAGTAPLAVRKVLELCQGYCSCEQPDTLTFDASNAVSEAEQRALFADYTKAAKEQKLVARKEAPPAGYSNLPNFTAEAFTASERQFLGKTVGFRPVRFHHFAPVAGGTANWAANMLHGVVWSRSPYPKSFWVYVGGQGFYAVREDLWFMGVNA